MDYGYQQKFPSTSGIISSLMMTAFVKWKEKKYQLLALRWMRFR